MYNYHQLEKEIKGTYYSLKNRLITKVDFYKYNIKHFYLKFISIILFALSFVSFLTTSWRTESLVIMFISSIPTAQIILEFILIYGIVISIKEKFSYYGMGNNNKLVKLKLNDKYEKHKFKFINLKKWTECKAIYSSEVNNFISSGKLQYLYDDKQFKVSKKIKDIAPFILSKKIKGGICINNSKIRLKSDIFSDSKRVKLEKTNYYTGECTNESACMKIVSQTNDEAVFNGYNLWISNEIIRGLNKGSDNKCANYIGVSTLVLTSDHQLIILRQSENSAQSMGLLAPSGSGSAEEEDRKEDKKDFSTFIKNAMEREFCQECNLDLKNIEYINTKLIGYARILDRGGKPEFFGFTVIEDELSELEIPANELSFGIKIYKELLNISKIKRFLSDYINKNKNDLSFPLYLNIIFLKEFIENKPDEFEIMIRGIVAKK